MNVRDLIDNKDLIENMKQGDFIQVAGWLVAIDGELFILDENLADPYVDSKKIMLSNRFMAYPVRDVILPLGGGKSFVFHKAKASGTLEKTPSLQIKVHELFVENENHEFIPIDIGADNIKKTTEKYGDILMKKHLNKSDDWLDYCR